MIIADKENANALMVRQPRDGEIVRVNPDPNSRKLVTLALYGGTYYLIGANIAEEARKTLPDNVRLYMLHVAQNTDGENFLWPIEASDIQ